MLRRTALVTLSLEPCPPAAIEEHKLAQVLVNLLRNAADAVEGRGNDATIGVSLRATGGRIVASIADSGPGVPPEQRAMLFRPFYTTKEGGTGVGLAISAEIIASAGGTLVEDAPSGEGARFTISLPRAEDARAAPDTGDDATTARRRVLLVEDDAHLRRTVATLLRRRHDVVEASGGREAVTLLAGDTPFDVVLCDLMMRGMDGVAVYRAVCAEHPRLRHRFAFLTGGAFTEDARRVVDSGRVLVLQKPCSIRSLFAAIARLAGQPPL